MNHASHIPSFQAKWTAANSHLKPYEPGKLEKIARVVGTVAWNIISLLIPVILVVRIIGWVVAGLSKRATLPAAHFYTPEQLQEIRDVFDAHCFGPRTPQNNELRKAFSVQRYNVQTPDGVSLSTIHFRHKHATADTRTIIYYQPNMSVSELFIHSWLMKEAIRRGIPCNFIVYDSRSVSFSEGDLEGPEKLILDGDTIYQFAVDHLHVPPEILDMDGWSLGGGVSSNIKAIHPECTGRYVNERSFSSTSAVVQSHLENSWWKKLLLFWFPYAMRMTHWDFASPIDKVNGPVMIVHHPNDPTIPYSASCHKAAILSRKVFHSVRLQDNDWLKMARIANFKIYDHAHPLTDYEVGGPYNRKGADQVVADFLLGPKREEKQSEARKTHLQEMQARRKRRLEMQQKFSEVSASSVA